MPVLAIAIACTVVASLGGCAPPPATQLLLELDGDLDETDATGAVGIDAVRVRVLQLLFRDGSAVRGDARCDADGEEVTRNGFRYVQRLCRDYSLGPGGDLERLEDVRLGVLPFPAGTMPDAGVITVGLEVIGLAAGEEQIRVFAHAQFRVGRADTVTLTLSRYCTGVMCDVGETCRTPGGCQDPAL